jgi:glutamine cyclotransferase
VSLVYSIIPILVIMIIGSCGDGPGPQPAKTIPHTSASSTPQISGSTSPLQSAPSSGPAKVYTYKIVNTYPHDKDAFTQGLVLENGVLYEGTGLRGMSTLRRVSLETGEVLQSVELSPEYFGEGVTVYGNRLIQLTWKSNVGWVYDRNSFELIQEFNYPTEGWGITHDEEQLIMSDGTSTLYFLDPETFTEVRHIQVFDLKGSVAGLNELEYIQGEIYANIYPTDRIVRVSPQTGQVTAWIDLTGLLRPDVSYGRADVLNGIAYDADNDRLLLTGKRWPTLYEVDLILVE